MKAQAKKKQRRKLTRLQKWLIAGVIFVVIFIGISALLLTPGSTKPIRKVADRFQPSSDWTLASERVTPPQIFCIGDNPCPSLYRKWDIPQIVSKQELQRIINQSGLSLIVDERECERNPLHTGSVSLCHAAGVEGGYQINITQSVDTEHNTYRIVLTAS